jgi:hypothetical protein
MSGDGISETVAEGEVEAESDEVGQNFKEEMGMDRVASEVEIDGEGHGKWEL